VHAPIRPPEAFRSIIVITAISIAAATGRSDPCRRRFPDPIIVGLSPMRPLSGLRRLLRHAAPHIIEFIPIAVPNLDASN
jgi:hypothetical protein